MRAPDAVAWGALALVLASLAAPPDAHAELANGLRSPRRVSPVERALSGGLLTLRTPGSRMIRVVASTFVMGSTPEEALAAAASCSREPLGYRCDEHTFSNELPLRRVALGSFFLDRNEVTAGDYDRCAAAGLCTPRPLASGARRFAEPDLPATLVTAREAETYCRSRGARLPHESEFERAARGVGGRRYPWGNLYNGHLANHGRVGLELDESPHADPTDWSDGYSELAPVAAFPDGATPDGFFDLAGNAAEWTLDSYSERYDLPPDTGLRVTRGGSYETGAAWLRGAARRALPPDMALPSVGFRCARSAGGGDEPGSAPPPATGTGALP